MKKTIYILVASIFLFSSVKAQFLYGVKAGGNISSLPGDFYIYKDHSKFGFFAGVWGSFEVLKSLIVQAELNYSAQGNKILYNATDPMGRDLGKEKVSYRLNYINLPILVKYEHACGVFIETGLQAGLLLNARGKSSMNGTLDIKQDYRSFDLAWPIGAGISLNNGLGVNIRYNLGLINLFDRGYYEVHNRVLQFGLFYELKKQ